MPGTHPIPPSLERHSTRTAECARSCPAADRRRRNRPAPPAAPATARRARIPDPARGGCDASDRAGSHGHRSPFTYLKEVQRILAEVHGVSEQQRSTPRRVRIVSVEAVAEKWLVPRLASFSAA